MTHNTKINIIDVSKNKTVYTGNKNEIPSDYWNCNVEYSDVKNNCLNIYIATFGITEK